jgi:hypothetical protein
VARRAPVFVFSFYAICCLGFWGRIEC